jgi:UDP-N-acetylmuramoylalanine--D-glutamate ligase
VRHQQYFHQKHILVIGLAKSGFAAASLLHDLGAVVVVNDKSPYQDNVQAQELERKGIKVVCGGHPLSLLSESVDIVVKNPGIPYSNILVAEAKKKGIPVITEVEIAGLISNAPFIAITGSNGKTTTTTLIGEMLMDGKHHPRVAGNIGTVVCEVAAKASPEEIIVAELSSFQLMGIEQFNPKVAVFLNLFEAHLDYHGTKEEYGIAKANIFKNQNSNDFLVYNADDQEVVELCKSSKAQLVPFSVTKKIENGVYIEANHFYYKDDCVISISDIVLEGAHNLENIAAAIAAVKVVGGTNLRIKEVLKTFTGVNHRLKFVDSINGVKFFNDSKATNILATQKAISAFNQPIILLAGGLDRGNDFDSLIPYFKKLKGIIVFGQTAPKLIESAQKAGMKTIENVDNVESATQIAFDLAEQGDIVLLSPACASWDQYKTFEQRGDIFIQSVHRLKTEV